MARYFTTDQNGITLLEPDEKAMRGVLMQLEEEGEYADYPDVSLTDARGISLTVDMNWIVVLENETEPEELRYRKLEGVAEVLELWKLLARGELETIEGLEWTLNV